MKLPRYPVYVPSYGRSQHNHTARFLLKDQVPFWLVVVREQAPDYAKAVPDARLLVLPDGVRGLLATRIWIRSHAEEAGAQRHWQLDDNIRQVCRRYKGKRLPCASGVALRVCEDFVDRYTNVAVAGLQYEMFLPDNQQHPPFYVNSKVYSCSLINHEIPFTWRLAYNDDTDLCLQALAQGWCTVTFNAFMVAKIRTMKVKGGNTDDLYQGDGRLRMSKTLERVWPYVVTTKRRFQRPQHVVRAAWRKFHQPLIRRADLDWDALAQGGSDEYGMKLKQVAPEVRSRSLRDLLDQG